MSADISSIRRLFHWGPIIAISIIKCVTLMTLYMNSMWWPPNVSLAAFINQAVFLILSSLSAFNYLMALLVGPGYLPMKWKPKNQSDTEFLQYCGVCEGYKAPRAHHCRKCNRCVKKMDHHCPWINNCVGWSNHAYFAYFLFFSVVGCMHASVILISSFYRGIHLQWYLYHGQAHLASVQFGIYSLILCIFSLGLSVGVVIAVGMLLYLQIRAIVRNRTGVEDWILEKAQCRREGIKEPFIFPYDLGTVRNIRQVLNLSCAAVGDGVEWEVAEGFNQFSLTIEQIAQKAEKRARTRTCKIIHPATGSYIPLWSQGFRICFASPCTDEPRIKLSIGDVVKVTRWKKHWLFGERVAPPSEQSQKVKRQPRGWFPRRCAVELVEPDLDEYDSNHINDKKIN